MPCSASTGPPARSTRCHVPWPARLASSLHGDPRPTLVVWGRHDPYVPVEQAYRQADHFPGARVAIPDDSGHFPFADDPEGVEALIVPFLQRVLSPDRPLAVAN